MRVTSGFLPCPYPMVEQVDGTSGPRPATGWTCDSRRDGWTTMNSDAWTDENGMSAEETTERTVVISSPEELIASVPSMLGFPPGPGSVVVMCGRMTDGGQGPVVRIDVDELLDDWFDSAEEDAALAGFETDAKDPDYLGLGSTFPVRYGAAQGIARFCAREGVTEAHLVVVHEDCADEYGAGLRAQDAASAFDYWLGGAGTKVRAAYGVGQFAVGAPWIDLFGMVGGVQVDPDSTQIAAVHAFDGRVRAQSRDQIDILYRTRDADARDTDEDGIGARFSEAGERSRESGCSPSEASVVGAVEAHGDAVRRLEVGEEVDDDELAVLGRSLLVIAVRDELYKRLAQRGLGDRDGRRTLWWAIARRRPGRERSVALLLLGAAAYFSGSGVHAWSALTAALDADSENSLAGLLLHGLRNGLAPDRLRRVAEVA